MDVNQQWENKLSPERYAVLRKGATEKAFSSSLNYNEKDGLYRCGACNAVLFLSTHKFDSGSGWPSFDRPVSDDAVRFNEDMSHGMRRVEVVCGNCSSHLGHVFPDGPPTTGQRFCINGLALEFEENKNTKNNT